MCKFLPRGFGGGWSVFSRIPPEDLGPLTMSMLPPALLGPVQVGLLQVYQAVVVILIILIAASGVGCGFDSQRGRLGIADENGSLGSLEPASRSELNGVFPAAKHFACSDLA